MEISFVMFCSLMNRIDALGFYTQDVPLLQLCIYQLSKLVAIYLPDFHEHMYEEKVNTMYFASGWFLTSFAYVIQYSKDDNIPILLLHIFDKYLFVFYLYKNRTEL